MSFIQGNASDWQDFWTKLLNFLTTDAALTAAGENWTVAWSGSDGKERLLVGPGLSGQDEVYIGLKLDSLPVSDAYWIDVVGCTGKIEGAESFASHTNPQPKLSRLYLDAAPMHYWFMASGRRFMVVVKISTVFQSLYAGLFLPFGSPEAYPYPLLVGGSAGIFGAANVSARNWRSTNSGLSNFWDSFTADANEQPGYTWLLNPAGEWKEISGSGNVRDFSFGPQDSNRDAIDLGRVYDDDFRIEENVLTDRMRAGYGDVYTMMPLTIYSNSVQKMTYGILDGVNKCQGQDNSSENIIVQDSVNHLVVQNCFRTEIGQYAAFALR